MFRGQFTYSVDAKGRVSIPSKLRKQVSPDANDTFVMTRGNGKCIDIYPLDQWLVFEKKLEEAKEFLKQVYKQLDKAAKKQIIHPNTARRKKSRLALRLAKSK